MTNFEEISNVNIVQFTELLDQMGLVETFKSIYSKGGITYANKKLLIAEMKTKRKVSKEQKDRIRFEQKNKCVICLKEQFKLPIDHIIPLFMGGTNERCNLQGICHDCHGEKTSEERMGFDECVELAYKAYFEDIKIIQIDTNILLDNDSSILYNYKRKKDVFTDNEIYQSSNHIMKKKNDFNKFQCELCQKCFADSSGLRKHKNKKFSCVPVEQTIKKVVEQKNIESKKILEDKEKETQEKIKKLLDEKDIESRNLLEEVTRLRNLIENHFTNVRQKNIETNEENLTIVGNNVDASFNIPQLNEDYNIRLVEKEKERFDHIPNSQLLHILDQKEFSNSIAYLVETIFFNPKAPENMTWCINDKKSENGAIEYDDDLSILTRKSSHNVISKNLQNILYPFTDTLTKIKLTKTIFNYNQNRNYDRYLRLLSNLDIKKEYINHIKERMFEKRGLCKALWEHLKIPLELKCEKIKLKTKFI